MFINEVFIHVFEVINFVNIAFIMFALPNIHLIFVFMTIQWVWGLFWVVFFSESMGLFASYLVYYGFFYVSVLFKLMNVNHHLMLICHLLTIKQIYQ